MCCGQRAILAFAFTSRPLNPAHAATYFKPLQDRFTVSSLVSLETKGLTCRLLLGTSKSRTKVASDFHTQNKM